MGSLGSWGPHDLHLPYQSDSEKKLLVRPSDYERGRVIITIYNWDHDATVEVGTSAVSLRPIAFRRPSGDRLESLLESIPKS